MYVMNVGLDLRLVNTNTLEVVDVISYQKQIIGRQISAGVFDFLGTNFFDVSVGESALEPIQLAVRSVIERAVLEMVTRIYRGPRQRLRLAARHRRRPLGRPTPMPYQASQPAEPGLSSTTAYYQENDNELRVKILIAATALATLSATCAYAGATDTSRLRQQHHQRPDQPAVAIVEPDRATSTRSAATPWSRAPPPAT